MLSRDEMRQVERSLANSEQDTRDEIGFLLIHQGLADRFFPGTSVLHTRIRYALFVPWLYQRAASIRRRGRDLDSTIRDLLIELAYRLKQLGEEPKDVIGGDKLGQLTSQPPDQVYWSAMRSWGLLLREVDSRTEALRRLVAGETASAVDDDGGKLDDTATEVFASLPVPPTGWDNAKQPLHFKMPHVEREYLRRKLGRLTRADGAPALLARLVGATGSFGNVARQLPLELNLHADDADKKALSIARDAAALAAIGRAVYGALVEKLVAQDGGLDERTFSKELYVHFTKYGEAAGRCDLNGAEKLLPDLPLHVKQVLHETQEFVLGKDPEKFFTLRSSYQTAEWKRKGQRARLLDTQRAALRRAEWNPQRHNTTPLHYRWSVVHEMLQDLKDQP